MVLDEVWRRLDGVEPLSGPHGGPLRRTVKLILDPLVIRPVQNPLCAGPILTADGAVLLATRIHAAADVLRATAAWFSLLKQVRRALRITEGNPQDLYFQRAFELATTSGMPDPDRDRASAEATLREVHEFAAGRTTQALKEYITAGARTAELGSLIDIAWRRRPVGASTGEHAELFAALLDAAAARDGRGAEGQQTFDRLIAGHAGTHGGIRLWGTSFEPTAHQLGLTAVPVPQPPALGRSASKASLGLPFDRTIYERVFTVLQASSERAELPPIPELVTSEIARSCSPWALLDESLRVAATAGAALALGLRPIALHGAQSAATETAAHRVINSRWQREAYVLQARRLALRADIEMPTGPLAAIANDLRTPWRPYLRRLWVRLHGRDVREFGVYEPDELWDLLDGVARSVMLDHRMRVKQALSVSSLVTEPDPAESRAS
ncbi:hypothetical protein ACIBG0_09340 [Nocardia sp. NPDC050630]|uniref:hypothetical protein n=1 Tax=Nocardia sp. NPDC050630 TaxID=3364321 RepID=UPI0037B4E7F2